MVVKFSVIVFFILVLLKFIFDKFDLFSDKFRHYFSVAVVSVGIAALFSQIANRRISNE